MSGEPNYSFVLRAMDVDRPISPCDSSSDSDSSSDDISFDYKSGINHDIVAMALKVDGIGDDIGDDIDDDNNNNSKLVSHNNNNNNNNENEEKERTKSCKKRLDR